ncbi:MAG: (4Fe-4S)-binding protein [Prevotellaceae bacterium]|jgi:uncharacterized Fe-S cluster protein YjdI|nr:(4Fe-4S)-binding protein [Prevotellaceae bacterium]
MTYNRKYTNGEINVYWQPDLCVHAAICLSELPRVFNSRRKPWVDLSQADTGRIIEVVNECPTGALMFRWCDEARNEKEASHKLLKDETQIPLSVRNDKPAAATLADKDVATVKVKLQPNGPIVITGNYELEDERGNREQRAYSCSICRCGKSKSRPFCDGSHMG